VQITQPNLAWLFNAWNLAFQAGYKTPAIWWPKVATKRPSTTQQETYAWASRVAQLREWGNAPQVPAAGGAATTPVGGAERLMRSVGTYTFTVGNRDFESTIEIDRNRILDDTFGIFDFPMRDLGRAAAKFPDVLVLDVMVNGQIKPCYDQQNFFSNTHPIDTFAGQISAASLQTNYFAPATSGSTPLTFDNYLLVRKTMFQYKGEDGLPLGVVPDTLFVPPDLEVVAKLISEAGSVAPQALNSITQVGANDNVLQSSCKVVVIPELGSDPGGWYLADTSKGIMPIIWQERQAPNIITLRDPGSENVFKRKKFAFGVDIRGNAAPGLWWLMAKAHS
jgi:phage major head subunit gpT-like protein